MENEHEHTSEYHLDRFAESPGFSKFAQLMADKLGGQKEDYVPFLLAVSLDVATMLWFNALGNIRNNVHDPMRLLGMLAGELHAAEEFDKLADIACTRIGFDRDAVAAECRSQQRDDWPDILDLGGGEDHGGH